MDDLQLVRGPERVAELKHDRPQLLQVERAPVESREAPAFEILHDEILPAIGESAEVEDLHDVVVPDEVGGARLVHEAFDHRGVARVLGVKDLDGDLAADLGVGRFVDRAKAAFAEEASHDVVPDAPAEKRIVHGDRH